MLEVHRWKEGIIRAEHCQGAKQIPGILHNQLPYIRLSPRLTSAMHGKGGGARARKAVLATAVYSRRSCMQRALEEGGGAEYCRPTSTCFYVTYQVYVIECFTSLLYFHAVCSGDELPFNRECPKQAYLVWYIQYPKCTPNH